jgi:hypothetical protein
MISHDRTRRVMYSVALVLGVAAGLGLSPSAAQQSGISVNGIQLSLDIVRQLQQIYPVPIAPGSYWYDAFSGAFGIEGGPVAGQMSPGMNLGGPLRADASQGTSGVFINGRQLTVGESLYIAQACQTPVVPGRYWVAATGIGGFEGGPAAFNLALCGGGGGTSGGSSTKTFCDANGACTSSGILGTITTAPGG